MLAGLLWDPWSFLALFTLIHFGCWQEYLRLVELIARVRFHIYLKLGFMLVGFGWMLWFCQNGYRIGPYGIRDNLALPVSAAGFLLLAAGIFVGAALPVRAFAKAALGIVYLSLSWGMLLDLYQYRPLPGETAIGIPTGFLPLLVICGIWINDTMAYIVGSLIGRTPFSRISPKKTWEGTIGGVVLALAVVAPLFPLVFLGSLSTAMLLLTLPVTAIVAITGTAGDLLESKLKRMAGVKDSGAILPGHGGFMDRFDSLLLATPAVWLWVRCLH
jgi:phosphatidate cytidylyltransferase